MDEEWADKGEKVVRADNRPGEATSRCRLLSFFTDKPLVNQALTQGGQVVRKAVRMCPEAGRTDNTPPFRGVSGPFDAEVSEESTSLFLKSEDTSES